MNVVVDVLATALGAWSFAAHDFPLLETASQTIVGESADLHQDTERSTDAATRLVLAGGRPSEYADRLFAADTESVWIYLYQPNDVAEMLAFEDRIEPRYADYYAGVEAFYGGVFEVTGLAGGPYLGEFISFRRSIGAAREFIHSHEPSPDIVMIEDECRVLQSKDAPRHIVWLSRPGSDG